MDIFNQIATYITNTFNNKPLLENISNITGGFLVAFFVTLIATPFVGRLAKEMGAVDLPAKLRKATERGVQTRIHDSITPKLGGLAMFVGITFALFATNNFGNIPKGVYLGIFIIMIFGFLDDKFDLSSNMQLLGQALAAFAVVLSGVAINSINFFGTVQIDLRWLILPIDIAQYHFELSFPGTILTIVWILGLINVVNWVGGIDALNGSVTSVMLTTILFLLVGVRDPNIGLAILVAIHLGAVLGVLPFNYNPAKIFYGSIGDYLNGFLLAIFAITGGLKWAVTLAILALPIIDGLLVFYLRLKEHPEVRKKPWRILSISDKNHLHHRLLDSGFSKKTVVVIETTMITVLCALGIIATALKAEYTAIFLGLTFILIAFSIIFVLKAKNKKKLQKEILEKAAEDPEEKKEFKVETVIEKGNNDDEKFIY